MENLPRPIVIPTDFSVVSQYAIESAVPFAKLSNTSIMLVHIVKKTSDILMSTEKAEQEARNIADKFGVKVQSIVREGSIFTVVSEVADELDASLIIMGTHGIRGVQKLIGSRALKVIVKSTVPFIVVQDAPKKSTIDRILFPVDYKKECREKIGWVYYVAKLFDSKVHVLTSSPKVLFWTDRKLQKGLKTNLIFTEKFLRSKKIDYEIVHAKGKSSFSKETLKYAEKIDADMILITTTKHISWVDYMLGTVEEGIIANDANIPVMCINPRKSKVGSFSATGG